MTSWERNKIDSELSRLETLSKGDQILKNRVWYWLEEYRAEGYCDVVAFTMAINRVF